MTYATESGFLTPLFRSTYAVGHPAVGRLGLMQAAVLAAGPSAILSHRSAAELLGLSDTQARLVDLVVPSQRGRKIDGIRWHRVPAPRSREVTLRHGIRCTTVSRTLVDLAGSIGTSRLRGLVQEAAVQRSLDPTDIDRVLGRARRRGAPALRALLAPWRITREGTPKLRSRLEATLWPLLVQGGLPIPRSNVRLRLHGVPIEVDFLWAEERLVVETDGAATHATPQAFGEDRRRDQLLLAAGYRVIRVTWEQLAGEPEALLARILRILGG